VSDNRETAYQNHIREMPDPGPFERKSDMLRTNPVRVLRSETLWPRMAFKIARHDSGGGLWHQCRRTS